MPRAFPELGKRFYSRTDAIIDTIIAQWEEVVRPCHVPTARRTEADKQAIRAHAYWNGQLERVKDLTYNKPTDHLDWSAQHMGAVSRRRMLAERTDDDDWDDNHVDYVHRDTPELPPEPEPNVKHIAGNLIVQRKIR